MARSKGSSRNERRDKRNLDRERIILIEQRNGSFLPQKTYASAPGDIIPIT